MASRRGRLLGLALAMLFASPAYPQTGELPTDAATQWKTLLDADAEKAYAAMRHLASSPKETFAFLRATVLPAAPVDRKTLDALIQQLGSERFAEREKAAQELEKHDRSALDALTKAAQGPIELETKRRADALISRLEGRPTGLPLRLRRTIEVVEWIGTPDAKALLELWAGGAPEARLTHEAKSSLRRWAALSRKTTETFPPNSPRVDSAGDPLPAGAILRLGTTRWRAGDLSLERGTIQFTADGRQLVVCDPEAFSIVNINDGKAVKRISFGASIKSAQLTADGRRLVASGFAADDKGAVSPVLCAWDMKDFQKAFEWKVNGTLLGFAQADESAVLESAMGIRQVNMKTGEGVYPAAKGLDPKRESLNALAFRDNLVVVANSEAELAVYDWSAPETMRSVKIGGERGSANVSAALSPGNKYLVHANYHAYSKDPVVTLRDVSTLQPIRYLSPKDHVSNRFTKVECLVFSPDGKSLAISSGEYQSKGSVVVWDLENHKVRCKTRRGAGGLVFSPDSRFLAGRAGSHHILLWDTTTGQELTGGEEIPSHSFFGPTLSFFPDGRGICRANQEHVDVWELPTGTLRAKLAHDESRVAVVSPDSRLVATGSYAESLRVWELATGRLRFQVPGPVQRNLFSVAFSPDSARVNVWADDAVLRSWDAKTGRLAAEFRPRPKGFPESGDDNTDRDKRLTVFFSSNARFSSDGNRLLLNFGGLHIYESSSEKLLGRFDLESEPHEMKTGGDFEWLLARGSDRSHIVTLYNLRTRTSAGRIVVSQSRMFPQIDMPADGHSFAVALDRPGRRIDVFETATLQRRLSIPTDCGVTDGLAYSSTGRYLAASQSDGTILVYDLRERP